ncbi:MAG: hypothetical protein KDD66_04760 [Bdellovibrionales bacterium]|nr:hypothetical protein [Bdellovibrionales bacterium]
MSYDYSKRILQLRQQTDEERAGRWTFARSFFIACTLIAVLFVALRFVAPSDAVYVDQTGQTSGLDGVADRLRTDQQAPEEPVKRSWQERTKLEIQERYEWLSSAIFGDSQAQNYLAYSEWVIDLVVGSNPPIEPESMFDMAGWVQAVRYAFAGALLRIGFLFIGYWKLWIIAVVVSYFGARRIFKPTPTDDMLGICNPGKGPYYSGIWGKLKPNNSFSGTDFACPSLACPNMVQKTVVAKHKAYSVLKQYGASNETNIGLLQVILAYPKYPSFVPEERSADESVDQDPSDEDFQPVGIASTDCATIEQAALSNLSAALEAHQTLRRYKEMIERTGRLDDEEAHFRRHDKAIKHVAESMSPLGAILLNALTPGQAEAIAELPPTAIATAVLAIEAGKVLTFEEIEPGTYSQISLFPHLQARAVMQSIPSYIRDYDGDMRYQIRQAIYASRRHGDFGRTFLPMTMQAPSRALRDWLEVFYAAEDVRQETAHLVALDAHIAELHANWRNELSRKIKTVLGGVGVEEKDHCTSVTSHLWLGVPFKSVVLMPLRGLLRVALSGISDFRQKRIIELIELTRSRTASLSSSAGLPGFKRQAEEVSSGGLKGTGVTRKLADSEADREIAVQWLVVRRMLTKYNWLSTRVGDDAVPVDGILLGILTLEVGEDQHSEVVPMDALVPLRQRRFQQLLGEGWAREYYDDAPKERDVIIVTEVEEFDEAVQRRIKELRDGTSNVPPAITA